MSADPAQPMMNAPSAEPSPPPVQGTVLCIEDHAPSMDLVEAMLAGFAGVRLLKAYTGQEGIRLAQTAKPDLVLLDMRLPDTTGLEVVRTLNQQMANRQLRVVLLTSDSFSIEVVKAMSLGAQEYWPKPLTREHVESGLRRLLGSEPRR
jgi:CheY-like chemotaxis protein